MIPKTGQWSNTVLGVGDPTRFNLLGGSFGKAGDVVVSGGFGARFFPSARDKMMRAAYSSSAYGGSVGGAGGGGNRRERGPYHEK